jgi:signal transduction histidine kinase
MIFLRRKVTTIHRHSGSSTATIRITRSPTEIRVEVSDRGKGMPREGKSGIGIQGMRERLRQIGGHLEIRSSRTGTSLTAILPAGNKETPPHPIEFVCSATPLAEHENSFCSKIRSAP